MQSCSSGYGALAYLVRACVEFIRMEQRRRRSIGWILDFWVVTCIQMHCININVHCRFELCLELCSDYLSVCAFTLRLCIQNGAL